MLTTTAPCRRTAKAAMMYCGQLGSMMPTRSPFAEPQAPERGGQPIRADLELANVSVAPRKCRGRPVGTSTAAVSRISYSGRPG